MKNQRNHDPTKHFKLPKPAAIEKNAFHITKLGLIIH